MHLAKRLTSSLNLNDLSRFVRFEGIKDQPDLQRCRNLVSYLRKFNIGIEHATPSTHHDTVLILNLHVDHTDGKLSKKKVQMFVIMFLKMKNECWKSFAFPAVLLLHVQV